MNTTFSLKKKKKGKKIFGNLFSILLQTEKSIKHRTYWIEEIYGSALPGLWWPRKCACMTDVEGNLLPEQYQSSWIYLHIMQYINLFWILPWASLSHCTYLWQTVWKTVLLYSRSLWRNSWACWIAPISQVLNKIMYDGVK